jgi:hypothetical protein
MGNNLAVVNGVLFAARSEILRRRTRETFP